MSKNPAVTPEKSRAGVDHTTPTRATVLVALLSRADGATIEELMTHFGWQVHTARAMLSGLRKKGHAIIRERRGDGACYKIPGAA